MEVRDWQDPLLPLSKPSGLIERLALRAVPVPTGVVRRFFVIAVVAYLNMPTQDGGPAGLNAPDDLPLLGRQRMGGAVCFTVRPEDVGDLVARTTATLRRTGTVRPQRPLPEDLAFLRSEHIQRALHPPDML
jgi:hypothetical protein